jgi:hypothetical protein
LEASLGLATVVDFLMAALRSDFFEDAVFAVALVCGFIFLSPVRSGTAICGAILAPVEKINKQLITNAMEGRPYQNI